MANIVGRQVVIVLTNKSGGGVIAGDVVVIDTSNNDAFTTSTAGAVTIGVGVAQETIASNATGRVLTAGYAALVNTSASVTRGNFGKTHTVAKQAVDAGASRVVGVFCQFLTGGTTPDAILFGITDASTGAGGAPATAQFIVGTADGTLTVEKVRTDLYKNYHPDSYPLSGTTFVDEFDDSSLDGAWTWDSAPGGTVSESTFPGFLYLTGGTDNVGVVRLLRRAFAPGASTAFSVAAKASLAIENGNYNAQIGIRVLDSSDVTIWQVTIAGDGTTTASDGYRVISTASTWITAATLPLVTAPKYLLMTRDASNVYKGFVSADGMPGNWQYIGTTTTASTVAKVAIAYSADTDALDDDAAVDFVRVFTTDISATKKIGA